MPPQRKQGVNKQSLESFYTDEPKCGSAQFEPCQEYLMYQDFISPKSQPHCNHSLAMCQDLSCSAHLSRILDRVRDQEGESPCSHGKHLLALTGALIVMVCYYMH